MSPKYGNFSEFLRKRGMVLFGMGGFGGGTKGFPDGHAMDFRRSVPPNSRPEVGKETPRTGASPPGVAVVPDVRQVEPSGRAKGT